MVWISKFIRWFVSVLCISAIPFLITAGLSRKFSLYDGDIVLKLLILTMMVSSQSLKDIWWKHIKFSGMNTIIPVILFGSILLVSVTYGIVQFLLMEGMETQKYLLDRICRHAPVVLPFPVLLAGYLQIKIVE